MVNGLKRVTLFKLRLTVHRKNVPSRDFKGNCFILPPTHFMVRKLGNGWLRNVAIIWLVIVFAYLDCLFGDTSLQVTVENATWLLLWSLNLVFETSVVGYNVNDIMTVESFRYYWPFHGYIHIFRVAYPLLLFDVCRRKRKSCIMRMLSAVGWLDCENPLEIVGCLPKKEMEKSS